MDLVAHSLHHDNTSNRNNSLQFPSNSFSVSLDLLVELVNLLLKSFDLSLTDFVAQCHLLVLLDLDSVKHSNFLLSESVDLMLMELYLHNQHLDFSLGSSLKLQLLLFLLLQELF